MSYHVYPFPDGEERGNTFDVTLDGNAIALHTARVSAYPFNRRWPGHQRQIEQSEEICFASFSQSGSVRVSVKPHFAFESVVIRPLSKKIEFEIADGAVIFTLPEPMYITVEFTGRNGALHLFSDPEADYRPMGDVIYYGKGMHDVGHIELSSSQTLFLDEGAVVYACVSAIDAEDIRIIGHGILDNSKNKEKLLFEANVENNDSAVSNAVRRHTIQLEYCTNVEIDGITIRDSLVYNIRPIGCKSLDIRNVKLIGSWRFNSDGIDMHNCVNVHIADCFLRTFDDSICVKGFDCYYDGDTAEEIEKAVHNAMYRNGKSYDVFKNVLIERCTVWNDWGKALEIGAETRAQEICDVVFRDCDIIHVTGSVLDCCNVDYADVHDITYENIRIEYDDVIPSPAIQTNDCDVYINRIPDYSPSFFEACVVFHHEYSAGGVRRGKNRNITVKNIHIAAGRHTPKLALCGYDSEYKTENVFVSEIHVNGKQVEKAEDLDITLGEFIENVFFEKKKLC